MIVFMSWEDHSLGYGCHGDKGEVMETIRLQRQVRAW